jgi:chromatin structure-remodeling complex protein RSC7
MPDSSKRKVLGGTKAGNGAWAVAWVDTVMEVPSADEVDEEARKERDILMNSIADE